MSGGAASWTGLPELDKVLLRPERLDRLDRFADELRRLDAGMARRVDADPESVERGLAKLVLTLIELLRQLMERQAIRRVEAGSLTDDEIERLGLTFLRLAERMEELKAQFGLEGDELNLDLGPLGDLM